MRLFVTTLVPLFMARKVKDVATLRVANLRLLVEQWGGPTTLAKKLQLSGPSYLSQLVGGNRPLTEKTARTWEAKLDLSIGWFDTDHAEEVARADDVSQPLISKAIMAVGAALEDAQTTVNSRKFAELVSLVYEQAKRNGGVDEGYVNRLIRLLGKE